MHVACMLHAWNGRSGTRVWTELETVSSGMTQRASQLVRNYDRVHLRVRSRHARAHGVTLVPRIRLAGGYTMVYLSSAAAAQALPRMKINRLFMSEQSLEYSCGATDKPWTTMLAFLLLQPDSGCGHPPMCQVSIQMQKACQPDTR